MFIDVTRYGGMRILRLAVAAIGYLDPCEGGTSVHLIGGETLRVNEDPAEIESRIEARIDLVTVVADPIVADPIVVDPRPAPPAVSEATPSASESAPKVRSSRAKANA